MKIAALFTSALFLIGNEIISLMAIGLLLVELLIAIIKEKVED